MDNMGMEVLNPSESTNNIPDKTPDPKDSIFMSQKAIFDYASRQYKRIGKLQDVMDVLEDKFCDKDFLDKLKGPDSLAVWKILDRSVLNSVSSLQDLNKMIGTFSLLEQIAKMTAGVEEDPKKRLTSKDVSEFTNMAHTMLLKMNEVKKEREEVEE